MLTTEPSCVESHVLDAGVLRLARPPDTRGAATGPVGTIESRRDRNGKWASTVAWTGTTSRDFNYLNLAMFHSADRTTGGTTFNRASGNYLAIKKVTGRGCSICLIEKDVLPVDDMIATDTRNR